MSDNQSIINKIEHPAKGQNSSASPPPTRQRPKGGMGYILGLLLGLGVAGGAGFFGGQALEGNNAEATLAEINDIAEGHLEETAQANQTETAVVLAYTVTPSATPTVTVTATSAIPHAEILPLSVSVYEYAGLENSIIGTIAQGKRVQISRVTTDGLWYEISYVDSARNSQTGYVPVQSLHLIEGGLMDLAFAPTVTDTPVPTPTPLPPSTTPLPTYTPTPEIPVAAVRPAVVEVRSGAGAAYPVIGMLHQTQVVELVGVSEDGVWYEVVYMAEDETQTGFVLGNQLSRIDGSLASVPLAVYPSLTPLPTESDEPRITEPQAQPVTQILIVREGPHPNFPAVGAINANNYLIVSGLTPDGLWAQVEFPTSPSGLGWVPLDGVMLQGEIADLPVIEAPVPPAQPPIQVIIDGSEISAVPASVPNGNNNPSNVPNSVEIANLPNNATNELPDLSVYDTYAFEMRMVLNGDTDLYTYVDNSLQILMAGNNATNQIQSGLYATGTWIDEDGEDFSLILPIIGGVVDEHGYLYFQEDEFCYSDDTDFASELFVDFPVLNDRTGEFAVDALRANDAVFGITENDNLRGIPANHYQFLGYADDSATSGYIPTDNARLDLWYSPDGNSLFAFNMYFDFGQESDTPPDIMQIILGEDFVANNYRGTVELFFQPLVINDDVSSYLVPPDDCEYLFD